MYEGNWKDGLKHGKGTLWIYESDINYENVILSAKFEKGSIIKVIKIKEYESESPIKMEYLQREFLLTDSKFVKTEIYFDGDGILNQYFS